MVGALHHLTIQTPFFVVGDVLAANSAEIGKKIRRYVTHVRLRWDGHRIRFCVKDPKWNILKDLLRYTNI